MNKLGELWSLVFQGKGQGNQPRGEILKNVPDGTDQSYRSEVIEQAVGAALGANPSRPDEILNSDEYRRLK